MSFARIVCPVPEEPAPGDYHEPFLDDFRVRAWIGSGRIRFDTPCAELVAWRSRDELLEALEADPAGEDRLFMYSYMDNHNPGDPREQDFEQLAGPVLGRDVQRTPGAECWYRFERTRPVVERFPHAVLTAACGLGDEQAFAAAMANGADVHWRESDDSRSPMGYAIREGRIEMVECLIAAGWTGAGWGTSAWPLTPAIENAWTELLERVLSVFHPGAESLTGVLGLSGDVRMAELLAAAGADARARRSFGALPAFDVLRFDDAKGVPLRATNAEALLCWHAQQGADLAHVGDDGFTILRHAVQQWRPEVIRLLLEAGADPDLRWEVDGASARDVADKLGRSEEFAELLAAAPPRSVDASPVLVTSADAAARETDAERSGGVAVDIAGSGEAVEGPKAAGRGQGAPIGSDAEARWTLVGGLVAAGAGFALLIFTAWFATGIGLMVVGGMVAGGSLVQRLEAAAERDAAARETRDR